MTLSPWRDKPERRGTHTCTHTSGIAHWVSCSFFISQSGLLFCPFFQLSPAHEFTATLVEFSNDLSLLSRVDLRVQRRAHFPASLVTTSEWSSEGNWMRRLSSELCLLSTGEEHPDLGWPLPFYTRASHTFSQAWKDPLVPLWVLPFLPTGFSDLWLFHQALTVPKEKVETTA